MELPHIPLRRRDNIVIASLASKVFMIVFSIFILGRYIDLFDIQIYYQASQSIFAGHLPWLNNVAYMYPPLPFAIFLPIYLITASGGFGCFVMLTMIILALFDVAIAFCVYYIGLKIYSEDMAYRATIIYATTMNIAYLTISKYDAIPTFLLMLAILFTLYSEPAKGYVSIIAGLFAKIYPIGIYPFVWIYNSGSSIWEEGKKRAAIIGIAGCGLFLFTMAVGYNPYGCFLTMLTGDSIPMIIADYSTAFNLGLPFFAVVMACRSVIIGAGLWCMYKLWKGVRTPELLLKCCLTVLVALVYFNQLHDAQYAVWFMPFAALLLSNRIWGIILYQIANIIAFIDYPLLRSVYPTLQHSTLGLVFYPILFFAFILVVWYAWKFKRDEPTIFVNPL